MWQTMTVHSFAIPILAFITLSLAGCTDSDEPMAPVTTSTLTTAQSVQIAFLGDKTRLELLTSIATVYSVSEQADSDIINAKVMIDDCNVTISTGLNDKIATQVSPCSVANLAVIAVDARNGPLPVHREHILFARQQHIPSIVIAFTHSDAIDDPELLELEELEVRETLNTYGWNGDKAVVAFDSAQAKRKRVTGALLGVRALSRSFSRLPQRTSMDHAVEAGSCSMEVYALTEQEALPLKTTGIISGEFAAVIGMATPTVTVQSPGTIGPGKHGAIRLTFH